MGWQYAAPWTWENWQWALLGPVLLKRINQKAFETMVLAFTILAALRLLY